MQSRAVLVALLTPIRLRQFWGHEPPEFAHYFAPQRECQNAALIQMMEAAVNQAAAAECPISVIANPATWDDALANQLAFSDDTRRVQPLSAQQARGSETSDPDPGTHVSGN